VTIKVSSRLISIVCHVLSSGTTGIALNKDLQWNEWKGVQPRAILRVSRLSRPSRVTGGFHALSDDPVLILARPDGFSYAPHPIMFCCITDCLFIQTLTQLFGDSREEKRTTGGCIFGTLCPLSFGRYVGTN
jgi:hypothetical protein